MCGLGGRRHIMPVCKRAASDIIDWFHGGSKTSSTSALATVGMISSFSRRSFAFSPSILFSSLMTLVLLYSGVADHPAAQGALRGMGAVVGGLIMATAIKLLGALGSNPMGRTACGLIAVATFVAVVVFRVPLPWTLATVGLAACLWAYHRLGKAAPEKGTGA